MKNVNKWEDELESEGIILIKFYLSVSQKSQTLRFKLRESSPLKYWKLSENDLEVAKEWDLFTYYKEQMFNQTSTNKNPWVIINSDNKMIARLNAMRYVLSHINYKNKKILKSNHWSEEIENYSIRFNNVLFDNLSKEQYELLFSMQSHK